MKKLILLLLITSLMTSCKSTWHLYKPAQSDIIGKKVLSYTKKNKQISLGAVNTRSGTVETTDNPSTATENQEIEKDFKLDIKGFFNKNTKVTKVNVTNATVTNIKSIKDIKPGNFVYSAIKADKVTVTLKNESKTEIKPEELAAELEKYIKTINPAITDAAKLVKEVSFSSTDESTYEILNPDVYYIYQEAKLLENQGIKNTYFKNFTTIEGGEFELSENYSVSKTLYPIISKEFRSVVDRIGVQLLYKKEDGKPNLYVRYTIGDGTETKLIKRLSDKVWNELNFTIKEYDLSSSSYKVVRMDISAKQVGDNIKIESAKVSYPEKTIKIIKR